MRDLILLMMTDVILIPMCTGQLILDQMTDAIISFNPHIKARSAFLSPNQRFLVSIFQNETGAGISSTTIIVQEVTKDGQFYLSNDFFVDKSGLNLKKQESTFCMT